MRIFCGVAQAVRLAVVAAMWLDDLLRGLADLRRLAPEAIVAAKARARAMADEAAAVRATARDKARAKREALRASAREGGEDRGQDETQDRETLDRKASDVRDRDPVVQALDRRLTVDPAGVDFDALPLRRTVERIRAALGITPDWRRWEAGDWSMGEPPDPAPLDVRSHDRARPPDARSHSREAIPAAPGVTT